MENRKFFKGQALKFGWDIMKANLGFFIAVLLIAFSVLFIPNFILNVYGEKSLAIKIIASIIIVVLQGMINLGLIKITLKFCDSQKARLSDLFSAGSLLLSYLAGSFIYTLIISAGLILLIVPGVIWAIKFAFFAYFIVEKRAGPIAALRKSAVITQGAKWDLFIFGVLILLVNLLGFLALAIGLFITIPVTIVANAFVYRTLLKQGLK